MRSLRRLVVSALVIQAACAPLRVAQLKCEYLDNPSGIHVPTPRLSWELQSRVRGQKQTAFRVLVARSRADLDADIGSLWDSGKVASDQSIHLEYGGPALASRERCWWKVRVWDKDGEPSAWSRPASWSAGLLSPNEWRAQWIGLSEPLPKFTPARWIWFPEAEPKKDAPDGTRYFRRRLIIPGGKRKIERAYCYMAADNSFELRVNGAFAGKSNYWHQAEAFDIDTHLQTGVNMLAVAATNKGRKRDKDNPAGLWGTVWIRFSDGETITIHSNGEWRTHNEKVDGWDGTTLDDAAWQPAREIAKYNEKPFDDLNISTRLPARMLRKEFRLKGTVRQATAYVVGLGKYELYVNGERQGDQVFHPAPTEFTKRVLYTTHDVTKALRAGNNALGVWLGNGRYFASRVFGPHSTRQYGQPRLLLQLHVTYEDGSAERILSDGSWSATTDGPIVANNDFDGEEYDARMEMSGWSTPGFDARGWQKAEVMAAPGGVLSPHMIQPMRVTQIRRPIAITNPEPGTYIFDMGQNIVGWCRLKVKGPRGTRVTMRHSEILKDGKLSMANIRSAVARDTYVLKGEGTETYTPRFTHHGFRYVQVRGYPGTPTLDALEGHVMHTDCPPVGSFECSNPFLNRLYTAIRWGTRGNYLGLPTDCPQRDERQGWLGDPAARSKGESYFLRNARFYGKWLTDIRDAQTPEGDLPAVAPPYWKYAFSDMTWPSAYPFITAMIYQQCGDKSIVEEHYAAIDKWLTFMLQYLENDLLMRDALGDWCMPPESPELIHSKDPARKTPGALLATAYYIHNLTWMSRFAKLLGKDDDLRRFEELSARMRKAFHAKFFDPKTNRYGNGTQTSFAIPLYMGLVPVDRREAVTAEFAKAILQRDNGHVTTGLIGMQWLNRALARNGRADVVYKLANNQDYPSWGYMLGKGATTIWELWNGDTAYSWMNSYNHLMLIGDFVTFLYEDLAGIRSDPDRPGFKHVIMRPTPVADLTWVKARHHSLYGEISSHWWLDGDQFRWRVTVPPNTTATVRVPTTDAGSIRAMGGAAFLVRDGRSATYQLDSGSYEFRATYRQD